MSKENPILGPVRGTKDLFGNELALHQYIIDRAKKVSENSFFKEFQPPIFEYSDVFYRNLGETSDIVTKETYTFNDRDKRMITLRPEFTASIARGIFSNSLQQTLPQRLFSYGPLFRHERPQKCRLRQFHQLNFEIIGADSWATDVEVVMIAEQLLQDLELKGHYRLELNSLGCQTSRVLYREALIEYFNKYYNELSADSQARLHKNPLRVLDSKDEGDKKIVQNCPQMYDHLTLEARQRFDNIREHLTKCGVEFTYNPRIVRGLDYYTHTVFEFITDSLGAQGTIGGGGRYDNLYKEVAGVDIPSIGFAFGIERIAEMLRVMEKNLPQASLVGIFPITEAATSYALTILQELRRAQINCYADWQGKMGKRLKKADQNNVEIAIIFGDTEISQGQVQLKHMQTGQERLVAASDLIQELKNSINHG